MKSNHGRQRGRGEQGCGPHTFNKDHSYEECLHLEQDTAPEKGKNKSCFRQMSIKEKNICQVDDEGTSTAVIEHNEIHVQDFQSSGDWDWEKY